MDRPRDSMHRTGIHVVIWRLKKAVSVETVLSVAIVYVISVILLPQIRTGRSLWAAPPAATMDNPQVRMMRDFVWTQLNRIQRILEIRSGSLAHASIRFEDANGNIQLLGTDSRGTLYFGRYGEMAPIGTHVSGLRFQIRTRGMRPASVEQFNRGQAILEVQFTVGDPTEGDSRYFELMFLNSDITLMDLIKRSRSCSDF